MTSTRSFGRKAAASPVSAALLSTAMLALAGCGSGSDNTILANGAGGRWNADDACKTLDNATVSKATGQSVTGDESTSPGAAAKDAGTSVSTCTYTLTNGTVVLLTRVSEYESSDEEIEQMRDAGGMMPRGEDVPGLGMKAFWTEKTRQIQVIPDRRHYFSIVYGPPIKIPGQPAPPSVDAKAVVTQLAKTLL